MIEVIGYLAALCLALSGIPFAWGTYKRGYTDTSLSGILLIVFGMLGMYWYEAATAASVPQLVDFLIGFVCWMIVLKYRVAPRLVTIPKGDYTEPYKGPGESWTVGQYHYYKMLDGTVKRRLLGTLDWERVR